ncbi:hypothetical protein NQ314_000608 [Rhamnusium bicolor]|uniref:Tetratricopeptide repeat protein 39C n=1 Tax=Rhamnusium bicolor TaxID=1586634 RepID=A0AAV8ZTZ5_9CUCU|nr:hypothetical protein NQ314_000608 [Rhamnusium bicolor]
MSFEEEKLAKAIGMLKEVEKRCATESGWLKQVTKVFGGPERTGPKSLAEQLETQIILADSQVCIAILTFLQQEISGYFKGGWVLRKAWKVYQKAYKEILNLYMEHIGELHLPDPAQISITPTDPSPDYQSESTTEWEIPETYTNGYTKSFKIPHSQSAVLRKASNGKEFICSNSAESSRSNEISNSHKKKFTFLTKSASINGGLTNHLSKESWSSRFSPFHNSFSLYSFPSPLSLFSSHENINHQPIEKEIIIRLMGAVSFGYGLFQLGISLLPPSLMKLTNILGFGANRQNGIASLMYARLGVDMRAPLATLSLLWYHTIVRPFLRHRRQQCTGWSRCFNFAAKRSDIKSALKSFQQAVDNANQREIKILGLHEVGWCHLIELDYCAAESTFLHLKATSRWSRSFYAYLAAICTGACESSSNLQVIKELHQGITGVPKGGQLDEFLNRRVKCCPTDMEKVKSKKSIYWKLLIFEMLYLWNALPSCSKENINQILNDCNEISDEENDEPMTGLSKLILGCTYCVQRQYEQGIEYFRKCLEMRKNIAPNADDAHVSAFCQYELGALLLRKEETKEEGKMLLQQIGQYSKYDFEQKLTVRVYSLLKQI